MRTLLVSIGVYLLLLLPVNCEAKPAPNLYKVEITHVGADYTGWIPVNKIADTVFSGQRLYIAIKFSGYPKPDQVELYHNYQRIPQTELAEPFGRIAIGKPQITGWIYQFALPITRGNGMVSVQAEGINGSRFYDTIYGLKSVYRK